MVAKADRHRRLLVGGFFILLLVLALVLHDDYGVSWDEPDFYTYGDLLLWFYRRGDRSFETFSNLRYYGGSIALLHAVVRAVVRPSAADAVHLAHLVNFLIFSAGVAAFYKLLLVQTRRWGWALFGAALLVLSPRLFSHGWVNPKDSPFLVLFVVNMLLLVLYLEQRRIYLLPLLGLASALLVNIRIVGLIIVPMVVAALLADAVTAPPGRRLLEMMRDCGLYAVVLLPATYSLWPFLWPAPRSRFLETLQVMSDFPGPGGVAYLGEHVLTLALPWHYVPVWIAVTTPLPYLVLATVGATLKLGRNAPLLARLYRERSLDRHYFVYAVWLLTVPVLVVVRHSNLYDEWRQVNFVYPALLLFAVAGAISVHDRLGGGARKVFMGAVVTAAVWVGVTMTMLHPYQALYFNASTGGVEGAEHRFELDYWGLSYREGLERLLAHFPGETLDVWSCTNPGRFNAVLLPRPDRDRLHFVETVEEASLAICAPREAWIGLGGAEELLADYPTIFTIERGGGTFLYVKDLRSPR